MVEAVAAPCAPKSAWGKGVGGEERGREKGEGEGGARERGEGK